MATATRVPCAWRCSISAVRFRTRPLLPGSWRSTPNTSSSAIAVSTSATRTSSPSGSARVCTTAMVWGWQSASTTNVSPAAVPTRCSKVIASAAAVASSRSDALASSVPVRSVTIVWKFSSASRRPWEISGWYGV